MDRRQQDPDRVRKSERAQTAGPLIRATTIPTAKFDADATHWSAMVVVARLAALPRRGHRVRNRAVDVLVTSLGLREQGARWRAYASWRCRARQSTGNDLQHTEAEAPTQIQQLHGPPRFSGCSSGDRRDEGNLNAPLLATKEFVPLW